MGVKNAKKFWERMTSDKEFRETILSAEDAAERTKLTQAEGYEFSHEDLMEVVREMGDDVTNEGLKKISGGKDARKIWAGARDSSQVQC